jgi:hypothetical protein
MEWLGLIFEVIFLAFGVYVYLFAIGKINAKDPETQKRMDSVRSGNAWWLRPAALLLIALMLVEIVLHVRQLFFG